MKLLVDVSMIALLAVLGVDILAVTYAVIQGDSDVLLDFLELTQGEFEAPIWFAALILATSFFTWICVVMVFWPLHQIIRLKVFSFSAIGSKLKQSAFAGIGFWGGSTLLFSLFPLFMVWRWPTDVVSESAYIPLGFETIFLLMSFTFLAIGRTLERADAIEEENSQFL